MSTTKPSAWMGLFFIAEGFLLALALQVTVPNWAARLCGLVFVVTNLALSRYWRRGRQSPGSEASGVLLE